MTALFVTLVYSFLVTRRRRVAGGECGSRVSQAELDLPCERLRSSKHALRDPYRLLERRHGLAEIVERGGGVLGALANDPCTPLDDLSEAVNTLAETARTARRVLGGAHPLTTAIEKNLPRARARAALRARETPASSA